ncbi:hypothetical protein Cgig2_027114 [Carnegiea gigantea]|uniref:Uncharacterized protein n=1 Tax=Carnegiea gigantea TaxID=171969 RepID=A0A9Q1JU28_9CARY|nr:hypothetical protein Cgig2_027114 [Carnegiea gigantea]
MEIPSNLEFIMAWFWIKAYDVLAKKQSTSFASLIALNNGEVVSCDEATPYGVNKAPCFWMDIDKASLKWNPLRHLGMLEMKFVNSKLNSKANRMLYVEDRFLGKFTSVKKKTFFGYNGLALTISVGIVEEEIKAMVGHADYVVAMVHGSRLKSSNAVWKQISKL